MFKNPKLIFFLSFLLIDLILVGLWFNSSKSLASNLVNQESAPNLRDYKSFDDLKRYFSDLANKKGAVKAFNSLKYAQLPDGVDTHLLGHVIGDILYKQQGIEGIKYCTDDFRNACSHTIVVGLLLDKGESVLSQIADVCRQAPGGPGAYTMCYHGLGHGVLAYTNYDLPKAVDLCQKVGTAKYGYQESSECVGGAIMEIITGGDHDKVTWERQSKKYLTTSDPLYPCTADYIKGQDKFMCLMYLTPHLFILGGESLSEIKPSAYQKAFGFCDLLPSDDQNDRQACYGGFGKEFLVLARAHDIRSVDQIDDKEIKQINDWCNLSANPEGAAYCLDSALASMYWGGENHPDASIRFCNLQSDSRQDRCFNYFLGMVNTFISSPSQKQEVCAKFPDTRKSTCQTALQID